MVGGRNRLKNSTRRRRMTPATFLVENGTCGKNVSNTARAKNRNGTDAKDADENKRLTERYEIIICCCCAWCRTTAGNDGRPTANHAAHIINTDRLSRYQRYGGGGGSDAHAPSQRECERFINLGRRRRQRPGRSAAALPSLPLPPTCNRLRTYRRRQAFCCCITAAAAAPPTPVGFCLPTVGPLTVTRIPKDRTTVAAAPMTVFQ